MDIINIHLKITQFLSANMLVFIVLLCFISCVKPDKKENSHVFGQENAVWTESMYLRGYKPSNDKKLTDEDLINYAKTLKENNVKYAYIFAGPYQSDGHLPAYSFSDLAKNSVKRIQQLYPEVVILPWIGGIQNKTVFLGDSIWVKNALDDTRKLIRSLNVPGVHVDLEYVVRGDFYLDSSLQHMNESDSESYGVNVNSFHEKLRSILPNAFISSVVVSTAPDTRPWKRKTSMEELSVLVKYVDQLSFLYYDTRINDQEIFRRNCVSQIEDIKKLKKLGHNTQLLLAIGTFINEPELRKYRNLRIENIPNSLGVIRKSAIEVSSSEKYVDGIAIFCDWATDNGEWQDFRENWVNRTVPLQPEKSSDSY